MWNKTVLLILGTLAIVHGQGNKYLPPNNAYLPVLEPDISLESAAAGDNLALSRPTIQADSAVDSEEHHHHDHGDHDHHLHWDLRESIPGEPGVDYPLHHTVPDHDFSCNGRILGYYADVSSGCQAFHVCRGDDLPVESFLCPNGTIFHQKLFSCDWWNNVDCAQSESSYSLNNEIGVVPPSNAFRMPVQRLLPRPIVVSDSNENDIQFQSQSSNDVENGREYLPPVTDTRKPVQVPAYSGPPSYQASRTPVRQRPTQQRIQPTQAPTRPVTPERDYLSSFEAQKISSVVQQVQPVNRRPVQQRVQPQVVVTKESGYLPPSRAPVVQQTRRPVQQTQYVSPAPQRPAVESNLIIQQQPAKSVPRPVPIQPQRPVVTQIRPVPVNQRPSFIETDGYDYPKPSPAFQLPSTTTTRPFVSQSFVSQTPRPQVIVTTPAPATFTPAPVIISTQRPPLIPQQSFSQSEGYKYDRPAISFNLPSSTARPFVTQTFAPQTQRTPAQVIVTTQAPIRQTFAAVTPRPVVISTQRQPLIPQQSFSQSQGYNYDRPAISFNEPSTTARPFVSQTFAPQTPQVIITTRAPVTQTFAPVRQTFAPVRQTFAPVTTPRPVIPQQSFSQSQGYNYDRPAVSFPDPTTTARPFVSQTFAPQVIITTRAPVRQTFAPVTQTFAPVRQTFAPVTAPRPVIPQQSFSQSQGYNYDRPAVSFPVPSSTARPFVSQTFAPQTERTPVQVIITTQAPVRQTFAPVTTPRPVIPQQSFSQSQGYNYDRPSVSFSLPSTQQPQPAVPQQVFVQTQAPVRQTFAPVTTSRPVIPQQSFSQSQGYNYDRPSVSFSLPSTQRPQPVVPQQVFVPTQAPVRQTFAPVTTPRPVIPQQSFSQSQGYNYDRPSVSFSLPSTQRPQPVVPQQVFVPTQAPVRQTFAPVTTPRPVIPQQSFSQSQGYNYDRPSVSFSLPSTQRPQPVVPQQVFVPTQAPVRQTFAPVTTPRPVIPQQSFSQSQGYNYDRPSVSFSLPSTQRPQPVVPQQVFVQTQAPVRQTFAPVTSPRPVIPQQSFSQSQGYNYDRPSVSFSLPSTTARPIISQTIAPQVFVSTQAPIKQTFAPVTPPRQQQVVIPQQVFSQTDGYRYSKPSVSFDLPASSIRLSQSSQQQTVVSSMSHHDQDVSIQQYNHVFHTHENPLSVEVALSNVYEPPVRGTPPCQHAASLDPLDELQTPVVFGTPTPFAARPSQSVASYASTKNSGYSYPKPNVPFITPNNPRLSANSGTINKQYSFSNSQQVQQFSHGSFAQSYHSSAGSNNNNQGGSVTQQQQQQKNNTGAGISVRHDIEIIPSISYSFQLDDTSESSNVKESTSAPHEGYHYNTPAAA